MQPMAVFNLAMRQNEWLSRRQSVIAGNVANANTPGYKARDLDPFEAMLASGPGLAATHSGHFGTSAIETGSIAARPGKSGEVLQSGNNVSLEQEFLKTGEVMKAFTLNAQIVKSFNRMLLSATKA